ncbi:MAG: hypothetical protein WCW31_01265 [Patescibacteria group bacterium]
MKKNNLIFVIAASFFSIAASSVLVAKAATTWQGPPSNCTSPSQPGCNVDGVIWNTDQPQDARFNISGKGVVGGGLEVSNNSLEIKSLGTTNFTIDPQGGARNNYIELQANGDLKMSPGKGIDVKQQGGSSQLNIGNWALGGKYVDVTIYGNLKLRKDALNNPTPSICFDDTDPTTCRTTWPSGGGFTQAQADLLYVKKAGDTMTGDLTTGNLVANTSISAGNVISAPTLSLQKGGQTSSATLNNNFWSFNGDLGNTQYQPTSLVMTAKTWSGNKLISLDMRSLGNFNTTIGSASFGDQDNPGVFTRTGGGKTAEVDILSNSGGETWGSMTGVISNVPNAASTYAGNFKYADNSKQVMLVTPTYALDVKGDANFQNQICLGGSCKNAWPAGTLTGATTNGGLQLNGTTLSIQNCAVGQVMKSTGISTWSCQADNSNSGTITGVTAGTMLTGGGASGVVTLSVDPTQTDARYIKKTGETGDLDVPNNKFGVGGTNYSTGSCYLDSAMFNAAGATSRRGCVTNPGYFVAGIEYNDASPYAITGLWCCPL